MKVTEEAENRENFEQEVVKLAETNDFEAMPSGSQPVLLRESVVSGQLTPLSNAAHDYFPQSFGLLGTVSIGESTRNEAFERV